MGSKQSSCPPCLKASGEECPVSEESIGFMNFSFNQWHAQSLLSGTAVGVLFILMLVLCCGSEILACVSESPCGCQYGKWRRTRRRRERRRRRSYFMDEQDSFHPSGDPQVQPLQPRQRQQERASIVPTLTPTTPTVSIPMEMLFAAASRPTTQTPLLALPAPATAPAPESSSSVSPEEWEKIRGCFNKWYRCDKINT